MPHLKMSQESLEKLVSIILRTPSLFLIEAWFRTDPHTAIQLHSDDLKIIVTVAYYMALVVAVAVATMNLRHLVTFYIYIVCACLMASAWSVSRTFVTVEKLEFENELLAAERENFTKEFGLLAVLEDRKHVERILLHVFAQVFIAAVVAYLMEIENWVKFTLLSFALPVVARLAGAPVEELHLIHNFATVYTILLILFCIFNNLGDIMDTFKEGVNYVFVSLRAFGVVPVGMTFWRTQALPTQLLLFWSVVYLSQLYVYWHTENMALWQEGWLVVMLACMGECCASPVSLLALCMAITYTSWAVLHATKFYLQGCNTYDHDVRGWTEGFTMLMIAVQTDLLELRPLQRAFLMSILLFIVISSLIQSMYEIADPVLLALSASHTTSILKHVKALVLCCLLWFCPLYMTYFICQYFDMDFWLMVIVSSCLLTSVQVSGSLVVYALFMADFIYSEPWENLDDIVYYARAVTRVMEFIVAVFVVCFGLKESLLGDFSYVNGVILVVHCYFNVWERLQSGWKSFLLRREAAQKVESMPAATMEELEKNDDVCAICYMEMKTAVVTPCEHLYHAVCLRKWLYVKETCPLCHGELVQATTANLEAGQAADPLAGQGDDQQPTDTLELANETGDSDKAESSDINSSSSSSESLAINLDCDDAELAEADQL